jgi:hypothetical protein
MRKVGRQCASDRARETHAPALVGAEEEVDGSCGISVAMIFRSTNDAVGWEMAGDWCGSARGLRKINPRSERLDLFLLRFSIDEKGD